MVNDSNERTDRVNVSNIQYGDRRVEWICLCKYEAKVRGDANEMRYGGCECIEPLDSFACEMNLMIVVWLCVLKGR